jgi:hypothetical protein
MNAPAEAVAALIRLFNLHLDFVSVHDVLQGIFADVNVGHRGIAWNQKSKSIRVNIYAAFYKTRGQIFAGRSRLRFAWKGMAALSVV